MNATNTAMSLPPVTWIVGRIQSCRDELSALKHLLRLAKAAEAAEQARQRRHPPKKPSGGADHAS